MRAGRYRQATSEWPALAGQASSTSRIDPAQQRTNAKRPLLPSVLSPVVRPVFEPNTPRSPYRLHTPTNCALAQWAERPIDRDREMSYRRVLARLRKAEIDLAGGRVRPARGDDLAARVELNSLRSVDVQVAEEGVLPAAEGVVRDGHGDRHVHADHARLRVELELPRDAAVAREDRGAVAVRVLVHELERLVVRVDAGDAEHRSEDLGVVAIHPRPRVVDQRRREEEAVAAGSILATVDEYGCAFGGRLLDERRDT